MNSLNYSSFGRVDKGCYPFQPSIGNGLKLKWDQAPPMLLDQVKSMPTCAEADNTFTFKCKPKGSRPAYCDIYPRPPSPPKRSSYSSFGRVDDQGNNYGKVNSNPPTGSSNSGLRFTGVPAMKNSFGRR
jgi:hypothetical protein